MHRGKTQQQFAALGGAQRADPDAVEDVLCTGNGVAAGDQEPAASRAAGEVSQGLVHIGVEEGAPSGLQVLFEVVEHQHDLLLGQHLRHELKAYPLVEIRLCEQRASLSRQPAIRFEKGHTQHQRDGR